MTFIELVEACRVEQNLTKRAVCAKARLCESAYQKYIKAGTLPNLRAAERIAKFFHLDYVNGSWRMRK